jgi:predicted Zn-ribbon and HTH transcriptional regulator
MATINEIFKQFGHEYLKAYPKTSVRERKVLKDIADCRTQKLGGRIEECNHCGHTIIYYNSCRNRHCPQCQFLKKEDWIREKQNELLPFQYFHGVFTIPDKLGSIVFRNRRMMFDLLFHTVRDTLISVCQDKKYMGAQIGFFTILHTWGQKLNLHPHLHCVIPGGGISERKNKWITCPNKYLLPIDVLKRRFRSLFLCRLKKMYSSLYLHATEYEQKYKFMRLIDELFKTEWVCYLKESFKDNSSVIKYLGKYTHRIAISNHRIVKLENRMVTFSYKDYKDDNKRKIKTVDVFTFIRLFLLHVIPYRFVRIRYYGLLAHRNKQASLQSCRAYFDVVLVSETEDKDWMMLYFEITGKDLSACPECKIGKLILTERFGRAPPEKLAV